MKTVPRIRLNLLLTVSLPLVLVGAVPASFSPLGRVVFLKGNEVATAKDDGSDVKVLTSDNVPKKQPQWSPDGRKIAYLTPGAKASDPKTHANIAIIDSTGAPQALVPVLSTEADGTFVEGMRFVEEFGWYGNRSVFASGSLNPHLAEYRILDIGPSKIIEGYFGYSFATCADQARVAYVAESQGIGSRGIHVELQGTPVYSPPVDAALRGLRWSADCARLGFLQLEKTSTRFVVLHYAGPSSLQIEASLALQENQATLTITPLADSFLLARGTVSFRYDSANRSLQPAPSVAEEVRKQQLSRGEVIHRLGGDSPDWWEPRHE